MIVNIPSSFILYRDGTGDDFNYPVLIRGDGQGYNHALLGIFDAIAPAAAAALHTLDVGDIERSRHIFQRPTYTYMRIKQGLCSLRTKRTPIPYSDDRRRGRSPVGCPSVPDFRACRLGGAAAGSGICRRAHAPCFRTSWHQLGGISYGRLADL